jgi:hypothetical protein
MSVWLVKVTKNDEAGHSEENFKPWYERFVCIPLTQMINCDSDMLATDQQHQSLLYRAKSLRQCKLLDIG